MLVLLLQIWMAYRNLLNRATHYRCGFAVMKQENFSQTPACFTLFHRLNRPFFIMKSCQKSLPNVSPRLGKKKKSHSQRQHEKECFDALFWAVQATLADPEAERRVLPGLTCQMQLPNTAGEAMQVEQVACLGSTKRSCSPLWRLLHLWGLASLSFFVLNHYWWHLTTAFPVTWNCGACGKLSRVAPIDAVTSARMKPQLFLSRPAYSAAMQAAGRVLSVR